MYFSDLLDKLARGQKLSPMEILELKEEARALDEVKDIVKSLIQPGTGTLLVKRLQIVTGDVIIDDAGIFIKNNNEAALAFGDATDTRGTIYIVTGLGNELALVNKKTDGEIIIKQAVTGDSTSSSYLRLYEDPTTSGRLLVEIARGNQTVGVKLRLKGGGTANGGLFALEGGGAANDLFEVRTEGSSSGSTFIRMLETNNVPPGGGADAFHMYMKGDKLIIQFNALGTAHYFYLDLTATTDQHWTYSATAP